jgi:hypothetical protein
MMALRNKKGQGSFLGGDMPAIILIVLSIGFFLSSVFMSLEEFDKSKGVLNMNAALVDAASAFLKENAKISPEDLTTDSEFWNLKINKIEVTYGVETHVKIKVLDCPQGHVCPCDDECEDASDPDCCASGEAPPSNSDVLSRKFPIALKGGTTDLEVYPALVKVSVYLPEGK